MGMNPTTWWGAPCHVSDKIYTTKDDYSIFVTRHRCRAALGHDSFIFSLTSPQNPPPPSPAENSQSRSTHEY